MTKDNITHIALSVLYSALFLLLIINIIFSQQVATVSAPLLKQHEDAVIPFLKQAKETQNFTMIYPEITQLFENNKDEIFKDEIQRKALIEKLEVMLQQNPQSRDVLYSLYLLYDKNGHTEQAQKYLQEAKNIDPGVGR